MFRLESNIALVNFKCSGVHEVHIHRTIHSCVDTAVIKLPSKAFLHTRTNSTNPKEIVTARQFKVGDPVSISLGYNNDLHEEFSGFVKNIDLNMPLEIECEGYSYLLRKKTFKGSWTNTSVKKLLEMITKGTGIQIIIQDDIPLTNIKFNNSTGLEVIEYIQEASGNALTVFFKEPKVLWAGLLYSSYSKNQQVLQTPLVKYELGYNSIQENSLKLKDIDDEPTKIEFSKRLPGGEQIKASAGESKNNKTFSRTLNNISTKATLQALANEKHLQLNYKGYEGYIHAFLQPFCQPGYVTAIYDKLYEELNGNYMAESINLSFGKNGARRMIEIGQKTGFAL